MPLLDVRQVWVVQHRSTGLFLNPDLHLVRSIKEAGQAPDRECALDTGRINLDDDFLIFDIYVLNKDHE